MSGEDIPLRQLPRRSALAMCVYNGERYLQKQLDSITNQTLSLDRVVIVDDNSSDGSWDLLQTWKVSCSLDVTLIRNDHNLGVVRNFEKAALLVDAEIVFFADQDDIWYPDKVSSMLRAFDDPKVVLAHSDADLVDDNGVELGRLLWATLLLRDDERALVNSDRAAAVYLKRNLVTGAACAARLDLIKRALPFPQNWIHDEWIALVAGVSGTVAMLDAPAMSYRLHGANTVGIPITNWRWRFRAIRDAIFAPQRQLLQKRKARLDVLKQRSVDWQTPEWFQSDLDSAIHHIDHRLALSANPFRRIRPVVNEWKARRYNDWSSGELSAVHDILFRY
jgi:glycosyltransferase involved in cell wall biosynthesis